MKKRFWPVFISILLVLLLAFTNAFASDAEEYEPENLSMLIILEEVIETEEVETIAAAELPPEIVDYQRQDVFPSDSVWTGISDHTQPDMDAVLSLFNGKGDNTAVLSPGDQGSDVLALQELLYEKGYLDVEPDGIYGAYTQLAVQKYQMYNALTISGVADADTMVMVDAQDGEDFYSLETGSSGIAVYRLQLALQEQGFLSVPADGIFGAYTYQAVLDFQEANDLAFVDGIAGQLTMEALFKNYTPADTSPADSTVSDTDAAALGKGMNGTDVLDLQKWLYDTGYLSAQPDGVYGDQTEEAIIRFQLYNGLAVTGVADPATRELIATGDETSFKSLSEGSTGTAVYNIQSALHKLGYLDSSADGIFGIQTYNAVIEFQKDHDLTVDGIAGKYTITAIADSPSIRTVYVEPDTQKEKTETQTDKTDVPAIVTDVNALMKGMSGTEVYKLQEALVRNGYLDVEADGIFGIKTEKALKNFEVYNNLPVTSVADSSLQTLLYSEEAVPFSVLSVGSTGVSVLGIQKVLYNLGYLDVQPDGIFGQYTQEALTLFQYLNDVGDTYGVSDRSTAIELTDLTDDYEEEMSGINEQQRTLIQTAYAVPTTAAGLCATWVGNVLATYGISSSTIHATRNSEYSYAFLSGLTDAYYAYDTGYNANDYWAYICTSDDPEDLKPGMVIASRSTYSYLGKQFGHVGFYIGNDKVISSVGYIEVIDIDDFEDKYNNTEYGSTLRWGFAPTMTEQ